MVIQLTLQGLMIFLVAALGIAAGVILIAILWDIRKMVGILRPMVETNQEFISKTIRTMPETFENIGQISCNVKVITDKLKISIPVILQEVESVTNSAKGSILMAGLVMENMSSGINETMAAYNKDTSGFIAYFHIFEEVLQIIRRTFSPSR